MEIGRKVVQFRNCPFQYTKTKILSVLAVEKIELQINIKNEFC